MAAAPPTAPGAAPSNSKTPLFNQSTNESGWNAAIHTVSYAGCRVGSWGVGAAPPTSCRRRLTPGVPPALCRRWCTGWAATLASRPSTWTPGQRCAAATAAAAAVQHCSALATCAPPLPLQERPHCRCRKPLLAPSGTPTCAPLPASCCPCPQAKEPVYIPATIFLVTDHLYHLLVKNYMRRDKASGGRALVSPLPACGRCGRRHAAAADVVESSSCCCLKCMGYLLGMPHSRPDAAFMLAKCACQPQRCVLPLTRAQPIHMCSRAAAPGRHG